MNEINYTYLLLLFTFLLFSQTSSSNFTILPQNLDKELFSIFFIPVTYYMQTQILSYSFVVEKYVAIVRH